ncbi:CBS and ACT domain-containing protein [bacterium]|nr:CBS and ACT domain-containing protein [bacterium]
MLVKNWMSKDVISIDINDPIVNAVNLLRDHNIRTLPVLKDGKLSGIVTDRDLKRVTVPKNTNLESEEIIYLNTRTKVGEIMTKEPITVSPDFSVDEVARIMLEKKISGIPVVDEQGELVGIITQGDICSVLISLLGDDETRVQFALQVKDTPGSIKGLADVIRGFKGRFSSMLTSYKDVPAGYRNVYIIAHNINRDEMENINDELKKKAKILYVIDYLKR